MEWTLLILLFVLWSVLGQLLGARKRRDPADLEETERPGRAGGEPEVRRREGEVLPQTVEEWVSEELGINLERRPRVRAPEERRGRPGRRREERRERPGREGSLVGAAEAGGAGDQAALDEYRRTVVSLEEIGAEERGPSRTLERPRRAEDHDRFHERYQVPRPVASHREFHRRYVRPLQGVTGRRREPRLPEFGGRTRLQRMVIWSEILGRPRGLDVFRRVESGPSRAP